MSRRDDRSSDARRPRTRFEREPSPKRSRRDDHKLERERPPAETKFDKDRDSDMKHHRGLRDPLPLECPLAHNSKVDIGAMNKDTDSRTDGAREGTKKSSDQTNVTHSRSYLQHDDRASVGQNGRSLGRRTDKDGWKDSKEHSNDRRKNDKPKESDENRAWRHDGYHHIEAQERPPTRRRPSFREHKAPSEPEKTNTLATDSAATLKTQDRAEEIGRRDRRFDSERSVRTGRSFVRERELSRDGGGGGGYRGGGRERFNSGARQGGYPRPGPPGGARVEKWKHDLYDEANKSPKSKNEEDQISKIEALLAS